MILYLCWFTLTIILLAYSSRNIYIVFLLFTLFYGCRDVGGIDDNSYKLAFQNILSGNEVYGVETSFFIISEFLGQLGFNYKALFLVYAIFSFLFVFLAYKNLCKTKSDWLLVMAGFFVFSFTLTITVMRQFLAASIVTYAFTLRLKNKKVIPLILIGIAFLFHSSALFALFFYPLISIKYKNRTKILLPLICLVMGYLGVFGKITEFLSFLIPSKYMVYLDSYNASGIGLLHIILFSIYLLQFFLTALAKAKNSLGPEIDYLEGIQMWYFSIYFSTLSYGWLNRLSLYFILFVPFIFKTFIARFPKESDKKILYSLYIAGCILLFIYQLEIVLPVSTQSDLIPYKGSFDFKK